MTYIPPSTAVAVRDVDVIEADSSVLDLATQAATLLPELIERGAVEEIMTLSQRAEAQSKYESLQEKSEEAKRLQRLVVQAQAAIGTIDVKEHPFKAKGGKRSPLLISNIEIKHEVRARWRCLAIALDRGTLSAAMDAVEGAHESITEKATALQISREGTSVAFARFEKAIDADSRTLTEIADAAGLNRVTLTPSHRKKHPNAYWWTAKRLAETLGLDPYKLPTQKKNKKHKPRTWTKRQTKATGGKWDEFNVRLQRLTDELVRLSADENEQHDLAYEQLYQLRELGRKKALKGGDA